MTLTPPLPSHHQPGDLVQAPPVSCTAGHGNKVPPQQDSSEMTIKHFQPSGALTAHLGSLQEMRAVSPRDLQLEDLHYQGSTNKQPPDLPSHQDQTPWTGSTWQGARRRTQGSGQGHRGRRSREILMEWRHQNVWRF